MNTLTTPTSEIFHPLGFSLFSQLLGNTLFDRSNRATVYLHPPAECPLSFYLNDLYWSALVIPGNLYEPDIPPVLSRVLSPDTMFIDCGANIGYWSVYARKFLAPQNILAIEAFSTTFEQLQYNSSRNGGFLCILSAITDKPGEPAWLGGTHPTSMSLLDAHNQHGSLVDAFTLDQIYHSYVPRDIKRFVLKLDIEGMETRALSCAQDLLSCYPLIIYEDHGIDKTCQTSRFISDVLGYDIYSWDQNFGLRKVDIAAITSIKRSTRVGYNFFASHPDGNFIA